MRPAAEHECTVPRSSAGVSAARRAGARWLAQQLGHEAEDSAAVLAELLNNALMHTTGEIGLTLGLDDDVVTVEVRDESPGLPPAAPTGLDEGGRGLVLVDGLAEQWGVRRHGSGKVVWAHVREQGRGAARLRRRGVGGDRPGRVRIASHDEAEQPG